ncbi:META domain-containing protein [Psychrobacter vallis]|uniref:META domain-containing protein n=1 Tax=Psychrobacter vallis TaxID=248451 RepID=UPI00191AFF6C|nr:DUF4377 domain-containing protein [Psychrobacter vallis]
MTLSFRVLFVRSSIYPSMLLAVLALSACQDSFSSNEQNVQEVANSFNTETDNSAMASGTDAIVDRERADDVSPEKARINALSRYRWTLNSVTGDKAQSLNKLMAIKDQVTLTFNEYQGQNTLNYSVGCNIISASYQLQEATLTIEDSMSTKMSCGDLDMAENSLSKLMQGDSQLALVESDPSKDDRPILTQVTNDSITLVWEGRITAQAKYNSKGETVFWAVNAEMIPCLDDGPQACLQVKPVTYDDQGIKVSEGDWAPFTGMIEGYQHDGKHEEVLRLQRYPLDNKMMEADASGEAYAYVLDAVIESSIVEESR